MSPEAVLAQLAAIRTLMEGLYEEPGVSDHVQRCIYHAMNDVADAEMGIQGPRQLAERRAALAAAEGVAVG